MNSNNHNIFIIIKIFLHALFGIDKIFRTYQLSIFNRMLINQLKT